MSEILLARFTASDTLSGCFVGTADGNLLAVSDRSGACLSEDGMPLTLDVRHRPWYTQAAEAGELTFTGVEIDSYTGIATLECAAPVYHDGELVAVIGADIFLTSISDYVQDTATEGGFLCVIDENGQVLFSPQQDGAFKVELSGQTVDLRETGNKELADFVTLSLKERTPLTLLEIDGTEYYLTGAPMETLGWAVISVVEKEITHQPTAAMLAQYEKINDEALARYEQGAKRSAQTILLLTVVILLLAVTGALFVAGRVVSPLERMTRRINALSGSDTAFEMEDAYRTNDEIEILAESFASLSKRTRNYIKQITEITAEKERIGTELALATRIQADMLPNIFPPFPERADFDVYASMDPAKEVGGDFYDFFLIDEKHLGLVMADVSGKGVPAALFMMISKILVQNYAMTGRSPAQVLQAVNDQICSNNREEMFVTVWFGILDTETGIITAANAGHEYPVVMQAGGQFELIKDKHGLVIGAMDGIRYKEYELTLTKGSKLFLYTDGVPEATNVRNELFGTDRMLAALNEEPKASPETLLRRVRQAVDAFVQEAEQFDDLTMLCLEFKGEPDMTGNCKELSLPAEVEKLPELLSFLERQLEEAGCPMKTQMQISVAAEEIFVNIANYAYAPGKGIATVRLSICDDPATACITFIDRGAPFDPLEKEDPDVTLSAEEREIGGLGIYMTKKTMDDVRYEYKDGQNRLTLIKKL
ncbi:MAG: SpoIIE family protein phosphatase, partial [Oscillospiraceae bacterium]|nr:SpoIIE family protein phosphatase [Oscillospiraceae bacterium]